MGGLVGVNDDLDGNATITGSYSTGTVTANGPDAGGLVGLNQAAPGSFVDSYWDTTTSGTSVGVGSGDSTGVIGLTTTQLQSGLPVGFSVSIWGEAPGVNGGLPYLLDNSP